MNANNIAIINKPLLTKLLTKQGSQSDYKFAKHLGVGRSLWQLTRTGRLKINKTLLIAIARTYTDLDQDILRFLRDGVRKDCSNASID